MGDVKVVGVVEVVAEVVGDVGVVEVVEDGIGIWLNCFKQNPISLMSTYPER